MRKMFRDLRRYLNYRIALQEAASQPLGIDQNLNCPHVTTSVNVSATEETCPHRPQYQSYYLSERPRPIVTYASKQQDLQSHLRCQTATSKLFNVSTQTTLPKAIKASKIIETSLQTIQPSIIKCSSPPITCYSRQQGPSALTDQRRTKGRDGLCDFCGGRGHFAHECRNRRRFLKQRVQQIIRQEKELTVRSVKTAQLLIIYPRQSKYNESRKSTAIPKIISLQGTQNDPCRLYGHYERDSAFHSRRTM